MCGRYTLFTPAEELADRFGAQSPDWEPRYNCAPGQELPVVTGEDPDQFTRKQWGLLPEWADDASTASINARAETIGEKPSFADSAEQRRCLVPADGFYEWVDRDGGKRPYRVAFEDDRPFAMAGIWSRWEPSTRQTGLGEFGDGGVSSDPDPVETFAIVTTEPNDLVSDLHHRMAVILDPDAESTWLHGTVDEALDCCDPLPCGRPDRLPRLDARERSDLRRPVAGRACGGVSEVIGASPASNGSEFVFVYLSPFRNQLQSQKHI